MQKKQSWGGGLDHVPVLSDKSRLGRLGEGKPATLPDILKCVCVWPLESATKQKRGGVR